MRWRIKMSYTYYLPDEEGNRQEQACESNAIIIIGANGSGKSRLGAWMEQIDDTNVHRIAAQRELSFNEYINLKSLEQSQNFLYRGNDTHLGNKSGYRWQNGKYTTSLLSDYEFVLSVLVAKKNKQNEDFIQICQEKKRINELHCDVPFTVVDKLISIWAEIFPHRAIKIEDAKVTAVLERNEDIINYKGNEMSDGERVALYLLAQCLCLPSGKIIIIDEPELHLHRSIMNKLWKTIENERNDCLFIYITHDTMFAASHEHAEKIWIKNFDGTHWEWEKVKESELPEQCLLDILGNRKNVLFVEGEEKSFDTQLYREIYKNYYVIPCGGCNKVISSTKAMKDNIQLHHLNVFGLIDRDYRTQHEIEQLSKCGIFTLTVAEVENLFCVEGVLLAINKYLGHSGLDAVENVKKYIINERFTKQIESQICKATVAEVKYRLSTFALPHDNSVKAKEALENLSNEIRFEEICKQFENEYTSILEAANYSAILSVFNQKDLPKSIGNYFGILDNNYCKQIIRLLKTDLADTIIDAVKPYLPVEISIAN